LRQPDSDGPAHSDTDCNGKLHAYGNCYSDVYPYSYSDGYCNSNGHAYGFDKLHTELYIHRGDRNDCSGHNRYRQSHRRWHNDHHAAVLVHVVRAKLYNG